MRTKYFLCTVKLIENTMNIEFENTALEELYTKGTTQDHHYDVLRNIPFPKIEVVDIDEFLNILG